MRRILNDYTYNYDSKNPIFLRNDLGKDIIGIKGEWLSQENKIITIQYIDTPVGVSEVSKHWKRDLAFEFTKDFILQSLNDKGKVSLNQIKAQKGKNLANRIKLWASNLNNLDISEELDSSQTIFKLTISQR